VRVSRLMNSFFLKACFFIRLSFGKAPQPQWRWALIARPTHE
jgi:hypothetical protein